MSDKIYRTVTYEIEPSGDCGKCKSCKNNTLCTAFSEPIMEMTYKVSMRTGATLTDKLVPSQCQACKDYLEHEKAKVGRAYCKGCFYFNGETCGKWNETKKDNNNQVYSKNCKNREE